MEILTNALWTLLIIPFIIFTIYQHNKLSMTNYRDRLFNIRFKLFMLPQEHPEHIKYDSELYRHFERTINNHIRFAHKASLLDLLIFSRYLKKNEIVLDNVKEEKLLLTTRNSELIKEIENIKKELSDALLSYFFKTSIVFYLITLYNIFNASRKILSGKIDINLGQKIYNCVEIIGSRKYNTI